MTTEEIQTTSLYKFSIMNAYLCFIHYTSYSIEKFYKTDRKLIKTNIGVHENKVVVTNCLYLWSGQLCACSHRLHEKPVCYSKLSAAWEDKKQSYVTSELPWSSLILSDAMNASLPRKVGAGSVHTEDGSCMGQQGDRVIAAAHSPDLLPQVHAL